MFTKFEREIIYSEEKRKSVQPQTVRNTLQKVRDKAANAIEDLLFLSDKRPDQFKQVIGFTRSGRVMGTTLRKRKKAIQEIKSARLLKRFKRRDRAFSLASILEDGLGLTDEWIFLKELLAHKDEENVKTVDMYKLSKMYPKIVVAMLMNQFRCPKCGKAGLIFRGYEDWLWMHYNGDDQSPRATFCNVGKTLPENFKTFPLRITPQHCAFWVQACDELGPKDELRFYT